MILTIPCPPIAPFWRQTTTLDGVSYILTFRFNTRENCYYLNIDSSDGSISYVSGCKLVVGVPLLRPWTTPPGEIMVLANNDDSPPGLGDLADGSRCQLIYIDEETLFTVFVGVDAHRYPGFLP